MSPLLPAISALGSWTPPGPGLVLLLCWHRGPGIRSSELDTSQRQALAVVLTVAFNEAAVCRFGEQHTPADIIEFVAEARAR